MKSLRHMTALYLPLLLATACSQGTVNLTQQPSMVSAGVPQISATQISATQISATQISAIQTSASLNISPLTIEPIALEPVSQVVVDRQIQMRKQANLTPEAKEATTTTAAVATPELTSEEIAQIKRLEASLLAQIESEDQDHAEQNPDFKTQSLQGGEDVDIELFLYHPTYGKRAKSWGIDTAQEFLMAGKSPTRRWLLRLKLEGLFAPKNFKYQVLFWVEQADLLRVSGVSREAAWLLAANGITSVPDLARRTNNFEQIALLTSLKLMAFQNGFDQPSSSDLKSWVNEAKTLEPIIY